MNEIEKGTTAYFIERIAALEQHNQTLREAVSQLLEATPQEQCGEDCDMECCPWMQARAALAAKERK